MNTRFSREVSGLPRMPFAGSNANQLKLSVGADGGGGGGSPVPQNRVRPAPAPQGAMSAAVGSEWLAHPRQREMQSMLRAQVGAQGVGGDIGMAQKCVPGYPPEVVASMGNILCGPDQSVPAGVDHTTASWIMSQINLAKYAVPPTRLGWLCDSISFTLGVNVTTGATTNIAAFAVVAPFNVTPTRSFTMDALVLAAGTANDPLYFITGFSYEGTNFVGTGAWISTLYKPESGCCLCVRVVPIIQLQTSINIAVTNGNVVNPILFGELFGYTLFSGSP